MNYTYKKEFEVNVVRKIQIGMRLRINTSRNYEDIIDGIVEVVDIGTEQEMNDTSYDFDSWSVGGESPKHWVKYRYENDETEILPLEVFISHTTAEICY